MDQVLDFIQGDNILIASAIIGAISVFLGILYFPDKSEKFNRTFRRTFTIIGLIFEIIAILSIVIQMYHSNMPIRIEIEIDTSPASQLASIILKQS